VQEQDAEKGAGTAGLEEEKEQVDKREEGIGG
jgi:hypothetical protein